MPQPETNPNTDPNQQPMTGGEQVSRPEQTPQQSSPEQPPQPETAPRQEQAPTTDQSISLPQVQPPQTKTGSAAGPANTQSKVDAPLIADDVDVIEKEWVDKAKEIIDEYEDDPHALEQAFEQLQIEYHKKRYGRNIKPHR